MKEIMKYQSEPINLHWNILLIGGIAFLLALSGAKQNVFTFYGVGVMIYWFIYLNNPNNLKYIKINVKEITKKEYENVKGKPN